MKSLRSQKAGAPAVVPINRDDDLLRITFPEEDRHLFTTTPWRGEYRWFRSPNVIPLEQWRRQRERGWGGEGPQNGDSKS
jgi:hypothetical protein